MTGNSCPSNWYCKNCNETELYHYGGNVLNCYNCDTENTKYYLECKNNKRGSNKSVPHYWRCTNCNDNNLYHRNSTILYCNTCENESSYFYVEKTNNQER